MSRMVIAAAVVAFALAACAQSPELVTTAEKPRLDPPDSQTMKDCSWPAMAKTATLTQAQAEALIGTNADRLIDCFYRHRTLANYIRKRDAELSGRVSDRSAQ